ncbi:c-type cytochrome [Daejeonella sp.]|uniref:c-type cytochrome n=1 Tax=Daejeonella sp. TaxID=2805397 RepID=UPI0039836B73
MKKIKFYRVLILCVLGIFLVSASTVYEARVVSSKFDRSTALADTIVEETFAAPAWADTIKNPIGNSPEVIAKGEEIYNLYCFVCHGETGFGDGAAGGAMGVKPANFHDPKFSKQKDGAIFWKLTNGKGNMPPFKEILKEDQRWQLIAYLKEFGKKQ